MTAQEIKIRIEGLKQQLVTKYHPGKVILFGSAARESEVVNAWDVYGDKIQKAANRPPSVLLEGICHSRSNALLMVLVTALAAALNS